VDGKVVGSNEDEDLEGSAEKVAEGTVDGSVVVGFDDGDVESSIVGEMEGSDVETAEGSDDGLDDENVVVTIV